MIKYSIILPTLNAIKYLPNCVESIISQNYNDYELIISNNCSSDGTAEYLSTLKNQHIKIIQPNTRLSLGDHWNFALSHATGEWIYGIGSDDGVLPYFFQLLDKLTALAKKNNINIIKTNRVYYMYEGLENIYGKSYITYNAEAKINICSTKELLSTVLYEDPGRFFDIPQMYTTAVFHKSILEKCRNNKTGRIIQSEMAHDIYLGIIGCLYEDQYLYSQIPIGWVGSSPTSIGSNINEYKNKPTIDELKKVISDNKQDYYQNYRFTSLTINSENLFLATAINKFSDSKYKNIEIPTEFDLSIEDNVIKMLMATYKYIVNTTESEFKKQRLYFFWDMIEHKKINKNYFLENYNANQIYHKNKISINRVLKKVINKIKKIYKQPLKLSLIQTYDDLNRFNSISEVNNHIIQLKEIKKIIISIK